MATVAEIQNLIRRDREWRDTAPGYTESTVEIDRPEIVCEESYAISCGLTMDDLNDELTEIGQEIGLHMDDDRDEILSIHAEKFTPIH